MEIEELVEEKVELLVVGRLVVVDKIVAVDDIAAGRVYSEVEAELAVEEVELIDVEDLAMKGVKTDEVDELDVDWIVDKVFVAPVVDDVVLEVVYEVVVSGL